MPTLLPALNSLARAEAGAVSERRESNGELPESYASAGSQAIRDAIRDAIRREV